MKLHVENLGPIKEGNIEINEFTCLTGPNNEGKTYTAYALYGFLLFWQNVFKIPIDKNTKEKIKKQHNHISVDLNEYTKNAQKIVNRACKEYTKSAIYKIYATSESQFQETVFSIKIDPAKTKIQSKKYNEKKKSFGNKQLLTLHKESDENELIVIRHDAMLPVHTITDKISDAIKKIVFSENLSRTFITRTDKSDYKTLPALLETQFTNSLETIRKKDSFVPQEFINHFNEIINGEYYLAYARIVTFKPANINMTLSMDECSSAIRSLANLNFYLKHVAQKNDLLIIDEIEFNLEEKKQKEMVEFLVQLSNLGLNIFATTRNDKLAQFVKTLI